VHFSIGYSHFSTSKLTTGPDDLTGARPLARRSQCSSVMIQHRLETSSLVRIVYNICLSLCKSFAPIGRELPQSTGTDPGRAEVQFSTSSGRLPADTHLGLNFASLGNVEFSQNRIKYLSLSVQVIRTDWTGITAINWHGPGGGTVFNFKWLLAR